MTGRPTKYNPDYVRQAEKLCLLGATDVQLAAFFKVDVATINRWKSAHPEFCESLKKGKEFADMRVIESLYHKAIGYSCKEEKLIQNGDEIHIVEITKHYPPDTTAAIFWLKNRQREKWRDNMDATIDHNHTYFIEGPAQAEDGESWQNRFLPNRS